MHYFSNEPLITFYKEFGVRPFGILVVIGVLLGSSLTNYRAKMLKLDEEKTYSMILWAVFPGFLVAHFFEVLVYQSFTWKELPLQLINIPNGLSSMGGFIGALLGLFFWCRINKQPILPYADSLAFGLAFGWIFGRLGCYVAHDHPGRLTEFFLGVNYPGGKRHDLGLYEALFAIGISTLFWIAQYSKPRLGFFVSMLALTYGPVRFILDFLRIKEKDVLLPYSEPDIRYAGLFTPAQVSSVFIFVVGIILILYSYRRVKDNGEAADYQNKKNKKHK